MTTDRGSFLDIKSLQNSFLTSLADFSGSDKKLILQALKLATEKHKGQFRDEGPPYTTHCVRVASSLIEEAGIKDKNTIITALLHDTLEDTDLTSDEIRSIFGVKVSKMVAAITRDKEKETKQEKFEKTLKESKNIRSIKACD